MYRSLTGPGGRRPVPTGTVIACGIAYRFSTDTVCQGGKDPGQSVAERDNRTIV